MNQSQRNQRLESMGHLDLLTGGIVVLTLATALIHLWLGLALGPPGLKPFPLLFSLNALGSLILIVALSLPSLRSIQPHIRWLLICYTGLTILMWVLLAPDRDLPGYVDKALEGVLIVLLVLDHRRSAVYG